MSEEKSPDVVKTQPEENKLAIPEDVLAAIKEIARLEAKAEASKTTNAAFTAREKKLKTSPVATSSEVDSEIKVPEDASEFTKVLAKQVSELKNKIAEQAKEKEATQALLTAKERREQLAKEIKGTGEVDPEDFDLVLEIIERKSEFIEGNWFIGTDDVKDGLKKFLSTPTGKKFRAPVDVRGGTVSALNNRARNEVATDPVAKTAKELAKLYKF